MTHTKSRVAIFIRPSYRSIDRSLNCAEELDKIHAESRNGDEYGRIRCKKVYFSSSMRARSLHPPPGVVMAMVSLNPIDRPNVVIKILLMKMKWNEWGFKPPVFTYRITWARRTS